MRLVTVFRIIIAVVVVVGSAVIRGYLHQVAPEVGLGTTLCILIGTLSVGFAAGFIADK